MRLYGETERMDIILDTDSMEITVVQRWKHLFESMTGYDWTEEARKIMRVGTKDLIYECWNRKAYAIINTDKGNDFNRLFGKKAFTINFRIENATCGEHWNVVIVKNNKDEIVHPTGVDWNRRYILLNDFDFIPNRGHSAYVKKRLIYTKVKDQCVAAHEFGHAIGNSNTANYTGDEYVDIDTKYAIPHRDGTCYYPIQHVTYQNYELREDVESIMNVGNEIRHRHLALIRDVLQDMCPGSYFSIGLF